MISSNESAACKSWPESGLFQKSERQEETLDSQALTGETYAIRSLGKQGSFSALYTLSSGGTRFAVKVPVYGMRHLGEGMLPAEWEVLKKLEGIEGIARPIALGRASFSNDGCRSTETSPALVEEFLDQDRFVSIRQALDDGRLRSVADRLTRQDGEPLTDAEVAALVGRSVMETISACHRREVVHRDLSDTNILLDLSQVGRNGFRSKIIDFGQSKILKGRLSDEEQALTRMARGTKLFESPEMHGDPNLIHLRGGFWTDLFPVGALLWYLRIGIEYGTSRVRYRFDISSRNGERTGHYDLLGDLRTLAAEDGHEFEATQADLRLAKLVSRLTMYQPKHRGTDDHAIFQLDGIINVAGDYYPSDPLTKEQVDACDRLASASLLKIALDVANATTSDGGSTASPDPEISWRLYDIVATSALCCNEGMLVIGSEDVMDRYEEEHELGESIAGGCWDPRVDGGMPPWVKYRGHITSVISPACRVGESPFRPATMAGWFSDLGHLSSVDLEGIDTAFVSSMSRLFQGCKSLTAVSLPEHWELSQVETMDRMFSGCSNLVHMSWLYDPLEKLGKRPLPSLSLPGGYITRCGHSHPDGDELSNQKEWWDFFHSEHPLLGTVSVEDFTGMFEGCRKLGSMSAYLVCRIRTDRTRYLDRLFASCESLKGLDLTAFDTAQATGMSEMFSGCTSLREVAQDFDLTSLRWATSMFANAESLEEVLFKERSEARTIDAAGSGGMVESSAVRIHCSSMFSGCANLRNVRLGLLKAHPVTDCWHMFSGCTRLEVIDLIGLKTLGVQDMGGMFLGCSSLVTIKGIEELDTDNVATFGSTFYGCSSLQELDLSGWNTCGLKTIGKMCCGCRSLILVDVTGWDMSSVVHASYAFSGCRDDIEIRGLDSLSAPRLKHPSQFVDMVPRGWKPCDSGRY